MNECPSDVRESLQFILKRLADIVGFPERRITVHHDVDFDEILLQKFLVDISHSKRIITHWPALGDMRNWIVPGAKRTYMIGSNCVNFFNDLVKCCCFVNQQLQELVWR